MIPFSVVKSAKFARKNAIKQGKFVVTHGTTHSPQNPQNIKETQK